MKRVEAITRAEDVPVLDKEASTGVERISSHFTIAAAAAGLISDEHQTYFMTMANVGSVLAHI